MSQPPGTDHPDQLLLERIIPYDFRKAHNRTKLYNFFSLAPAPGTNAGKNVPRPADCRSRGADHAGFVPAGYAG